MTRVVRTRRTDVDLLQIWIYVAERNVAAADRLANRLEREFHFLAENPLVGESLDRLRPGLRRYTVGSYVVLFEPLPDGVRLLRVVHSSRDIRPLIDDMGEGDS